MYDVFSFLGSYACGPARGAPSGKPVITTPFDEKITLSRRRPDILSLEDENPVSIDLSEFDQARVFVIVASESIRVRMTSAHGTDQAIPGRVLVLLADEDVTSIDFTRLSESNETVSVEIFIGAVP